MAAVVLTRALHANRRGGGLLIPLVRLCGGTLAQVPVSAPGRIALKIAFMLFFTGNGDMLAIMFQLQVAWLIERMQTDMTLGGVQPA